MHSPNKQMKESILKQITTKPPIIFPLAALFQIIIAAYSIYSFLDIPFGQKDWLFPLSRTIFAILALAICGMRKWVALVYVALSLFSLVMIYWALPDSSLYIFAKGMFPFNLIISFFLLVQFKKFS
jgi:hypothetical protein